MFAASKIRRAVDLKASFLQCDMYSHDLTHRVAELVLPAFVAFGATSLMCDDVQVYFKLR